MSSTASFERWEAKQKAKILALMEEDYDEAMRELERFDVMREQRLKAIRVNLTTHLHYRRDDW